MLTLDGSAGEGGGQILRTALGLSLSTGTPFRIENIRARRKTPGLRRQHLTAVLAARQIGGAQVAGAELGSGVLEFRPYDVVPGEHAFDVGTAGSTTLVLQTVLPCLLTAHGPSRLTLVGGTHNPLAPTFDFLERSFLPQLIRQGARVSAFLDRPGFYPKGGGRVRVEVRPCASLELLERLERGEVASIEARAMVANLPREIAERELEVVGRELRLDRRHLHVVEFPDAHGAGNALTIEIRAGNVTEVCTGIGERGVRAEQVAARTVAEARRYLDSGAPVGQHLADQLLIPLALAGGGRFRTFEPTLHTRTNADVIERFLPVAIHMHPDDRSTIVEVAPRAR